MTLRPQQEGTERRARSSVRGLEPDAPDRHVTSRSPRWIHLLLEPGIRSGTATSRTRRSGTTSPSSQCGIRSDVLLAGVPRPVCQGLHASERSPVRASEAFRAIWWNGPVHILTWLLLIVAAVLAVGCLLVFIGLFVTRFASLDIYRYLAMAEALFLLAATAYVALRMFRRLRRASISSGVVSR